MLKGLSNCPEVKRLEWFLEELLEQKGEDVVASYHFAPTPRAQQRLLAERTDPQMVFLTGNTAGHPQIKLIDPLSYEPFVILMNTAYLVLIDSGGVQEEALAQLLGR